MGCANFTLEQVASLAQKFSIPYLEFRTLEGTNNLPALFSVKEGGWPAVKEFLQSKNLSVRSIGTSFQLSNCEHPSDEVRMAQWQELLDFARLADALESPYFRVFVGGNWGTPLTAEEENETLESILRYRAAAKQHELRAEMLIETHDSYSSTLPCALLNEKLIARGVAPINFIWDSHHTWRLAGETPETSWRNIGPFVRHVHVKDSVDLSSPRHAFTLVHPGEGVMPIQEVFTILRDAQYQGAVSLEWENTWHHYLGDLEPALAAARAHHWL